MISDHFFIFLLVLPSPNKKFSYAIFLFSFSSAFDSFISLLPLSSFSLITFLKSVRGRTFISILIFLMSFQKNKKLLLLLSITPLFRHFVFEKSNLSIDKILKSKLNDLRGREKRKKKERRLTTLIS